MPTQSRKRRDSWSEDEVASSSGHNHPSNNADSQGLQGEGQAVPSLPLTTYKNSSGWGVAPFHAYYPGHDDAARGRGSALQGNGNDRSSSATPETMSTAAASRQSLHVSAGNDDIAGATVGEDGVEEEEESGVPAKDCYFPPSQDNGEDDKDTFVDKGSTAAADMPADAATGGQAGASPATTTNTIGAAMASAKRTNRVRPAVVVHGPPSSLAAAGGGGGGGGVPSSSPVLVSSGIRFNNTVSSSSSPPGTGGGFNTASPSPAVNAAAGGSSVGREVGFSGASPAGVPTSGGGAAAAVAMAGTSARPSGATTSPPPPQHTTNTLLRRGTPVKSGTNTTANTPQYSRLSSSEAAPGVVYRATLAVRAMAMDPEQPVLWAAVGDDPLAALRIDGGELSHSKSVKDIEQIHCMAVVRLAEEHGTTFKSASASPRAAASTPKTASLKAGRRSKKSGRRSASTRKSGKLGATAGSLIPLKSANTMDDEDDEEGDSNSEDGDNATSAAAARDKARFANFLWCGLSRGHLAIVNMATLEYQVIHNAHAQTVNRIWYWETRNKVWTAGREKGVHVWDPQRRVVLKKRNIAAILTDAAYADNADKVFAVADDPCVRVFEPGGENVNVPKGQENRIKMKSDASVIAYHRNSGLIWVGLARGSVLMNPISLDVERSLPFTFSSILFEGDHAIIAGQESQNGENRLMVLDVSNVKEPAVLAYTKFANALPYGIHVIPHTRFAVTAQDDPKKGVVVVIFVYTGTATLTHTAAAVTSSKYPEQRTEKVVRAATTGGGGGAPNSPAPGTQQPLTIVTPAAPSLEAPNSITTSAVVSAQPSNADAGAVNAHLLMHSSGNNAALVTTDRTSLHRAVVVKYAPDVRTERKFNVEADHSTLVEAIGPEAQEIKSALKHLVKTTDEVRQSLVQQRSAEATLADFSRLLRGRQQWLLEQGPITNLPALPPPVTDRINREYVTPEGKTIATAIEQLQQQYLKLQIKLQQLQQQQLERQQQQQQQQQQLQLQQQMQLQQLQSQQQQQQYYHHRQDPTSGQFSTASATGAVRHSSSLGSPLAGNYASGSAVEGGVVGVHRRSPSEGDSSSSAGNTMPAFPGGGGGGTNASSGATGDAVLPPWAAQLAATLQRERILHEQQLSALQLKTERLAERNAALSNAFSRIQAHVTALGQQSLSVFEVDSADSTTVMDTDEPGPASLRQRDQHRHMLSLLTSQQEASAALFRQLGKGKYHKPKYVRHSTEVLVKAIDEVVRLTQVRTSRSRDRDPLGGTVVMQHSSSAMLGTTAVGDDASGSVDARQSLTQAPRYHASASPSPDSPPTLPAGSPPPPPMPQAPHDITATVAGGVKSPSRPRRSVAETAPASADVLADRLITSFRGACLMAEAEVKNLRSLNAEVMSFWARLQSVPQQSASAANTAATSSAVAEAAAAAAEDVTESGVKAVESGMLLLLAHRDSGASPTLMHLMAARVLQGVCWAECGQTVLRELTHAGGLENPFVAGGIHNPFVSGLHGAAGGGVGGGDGEGEWWRQGPLEVLDYESPQERAEVVSRVNQLHISNGMELSNTARIREALQARCRASKECHVAHKDAEFQMHRLPGALCWSQTALRQLFSFLENTDKLLTSVIAAEKEKEVKGRQAHREKAGGKASPSPSREVVTRTASAVGVAMTHWALFLLNLRAELIAVHHATRLYHAWCFGSAPPSRPPSSSATTADTKTSHSAAARRGQKGSSAAAEAAREKEVLLPAEAAPSLAEIAASLTSKGKLLLLYMQWCFPAFSGAADIGAAASVVITVPTYFAADYENDASSAAVTHRSVAECATMLSDVVSFTAQLLRRVKLLLSYCHAIRAHSLTALEGSDDATMTKLVAVLDPAESEEVDARVPTELEKAFLKSEPKMTF